MWGHLKNLIRKSLTTTKQVDGNVNYNVQVTTYNAPLKAEVIYQYGTAGSPPIGAQCLTFHIANQPENVSVIPYHPKTRFKGLKEGEFIAGNQKTQTFIKFLASGDIEIKTNAKVTIKGEVIVEGDLTALQSTDALSLANFRSVYNSHTHPDPQGGTTGVPNQPI